VVCPAPRAPGESVRPHRRAGASVRPVNFTLSRTRAQLDIRPYTDEDLTALVAIFTSSVHELAARYYTPQQLDTWAPRPPQLARWRQRLRSLKTVVATDAAILTGFISYTPAGHVDLLYTSPSYARRGVASLLYSSVESTLISAGALEILTEASLAARPFFEHFGFVVSQEQNVLLGGCSFPRYAMRKAVGRPQVRPNHRWRGP
jgi:putative acetyltransferase